MSWWIVDNAPQNGCLEFLADDDECVKPEDQPNPDPVAGSIDGANDMLGQRVPAVRMVSRLIGVLESLQPRDLVRFDDQARSYYSGIRWSELPRLRGEDGPDGERRSMRDRLLHRGGRPAEPSQASWALWGVLALVSGDGYERERAIRAAPLRPLIVRLLVLRCIDWVPEVRAAALDRLDECPSRQLVDALPLAEQLVAERARGEILSSFLDTRLTDEDLRRAYGSPDAQTRRAAWRRLRARGAATPSELADVAARDEDVVVRRIAAGALEDPPVEARRRLAELLVGDRVGSVAAPALGALVKLDGTPPILTALTGSGPALRRAARDWASIRGVDARNVYLGRLAGDPTDALALVALAEVGDQRDKELFRRMLEHGRTRIRAAGLRGLGRVDRPAARRAALQALTSGAAGRITWTAANILRDGTPSRYEISAISRIALDPTRTASRRFRCLSLLRAARWPHLAALLEARETAEDANVRQRLDTEIRSWVRSSGRVSRGPDADVRERIERLLPLVSDGLQREIEFVLRTSA